VDAREEKQAATPQERYEVSGKLQDSRGLPNNRVTIEVLEVAYIRDYAIFLFTGKHITYPKSQKKYSEISRTYSATIDTIMRELNERDKICVKR